MEAARWEQVQELFHAALTQPATMRVDFVRSICPTDRALEAEVLKYAACRQCRRFAS